MNQREVRSRFAPQVRAGLRLEERDEELLCDLLRFRALSREQIQALYFSSLVRCNARLRQLFDHRFVLRHYPPAAPYGAQAIYTLGRAGVPVVARRWKIEPAEVARLARSSYTPTFLEHTLAVADIYLGFQKSVSSRDDVYIERWLSEVECRHEWEIRPTAGGKWRKEVFRPDGFVRLMQDTLHHNYFIEADLGHTSARQFTEKMLTHRRYLESGLFQQIYGDASFRTLVVTPGERRAKNLRALAEQNRTDLFWFTTFAALERDGVLAPIWAKPASNQSETLLPS